MLIDAGIGPRAAAKRLEGTRLGIEAITAICLTHLDRDHFTPNWFRTIIRRHIRIHCHAARVRGLMSLCPSQQAKAVNPLVQAFDGRAFRPLAGLELSPIRFDHDEAGSHGFLIEGFGCRVGFATDLGRVPSELFELFRDLDLLALESNYDRQMQLASERPTFLKQRIMNGAGHLSNEQAYEAVRGILDRCEAEGAAPPAHIVLLHRSRECNCPALVRRLFSRDPRMAARLVLAEQNDRTDWLTARRRGLAVGQQLLLAW